MAERSKALVLGTSPFGGVGSNPTAASFTNYEKPVKFLRKKILNGFWEYNRSWQDSNLRSQRESDFKSDALTARPQLLYIIQLRLFDMGRILRRCGYFAGQLKTLIVAPPQGTTARRTCYVLFPFADIHSLKRVVLREK